MRLAWPTKRLVFCFVLMTFLLLAASAAMMAQAGFTVSATPSSLSIPQNGRGVSTITTTISGGFNNSISLSATGVPLGASVSFNPSTIGAPGGGSSTMTIALLPIARAGTYPITVTGNGGGVKKTTTVTLTITAQGAANFTVVAIPSSLSVVQEIGRASCRER